MLLQEITKKPTLNNFVAKNAVNKSGAGAHKDKKGEKASRERQKKQWKREQNI